MRRSQNRFVVSAHAPPLLLVIPGMVKVRGTSFSLILVVFTKRGVGVLPAYSVERERVV